MEKILCAAIWYKDLDTPIHKCKNIENGLVICGYRHHQCIATKVSVVGTRGSEPDKTIQGFLTSENRFVDRYEAYNIALKANQIKEKKSDTLYSEDL